MLYSISSQYSNFEVKVPIFSQANPVLPVSSIPKSISFYDRLGFQRIWEDADYAILLRDNVEIHIWKCANPNVAENTTCRIHISNLNEIYEVYSLMNITHPEYPIKAEPWGGKSFGVLDPDGNLIQFVEKNTDQQKSSITKPIPRKQG